MPDNSNTSDVKTVTRETIPLKNGVIFSHGFGIQIKVDRGFLVISDGFGSHLRERRFVKAVDKIKHLVILGAHGMITLAALKWLNEIGASVTQITWDGEILASTAPNKANVILRRSQYLAVQNEIGISIARVLIEEKINGQIRVLSKFTPTFTHNLKGEDILASRILTDLASQLERAGSIPGIIKIEGYAAYIYWEALSSFPLAFDKKDKGKIPENWLTIGSRYSLLNKKHNYDATNPANAMLNYLYALLCTQARIALLKAGLDPATGILHADNLYRDSFAYDVMEGVRSDVDYWLLGFIKKSKFLKKYFTVMPEGNIRLSLYITPQLIETIPEWEKKIAQVVEKIKRMMKKGAP